MANAGDFAVTQAEELVDALDALTGNDFVMGDHHFTLQVIADAGVGDRAGLECALKYLNDSVAQARTLLADCGMTVAREDLALEPLLGAASWQLRVPVRKAPITSRNLAAMANFHNYPTASDRNHWAMR